MGKRLRSGGGRSGMDRSILLRRIKSLNLNSSPDPDLVIQRLRDHYPDYARIKLQPFSVRLREVLQHLRNSSAKPTTAGETSQSQSSFSDGEGPSRKKCCKVDVFEERLLRAESEHLRQLQGNYAASSSQTKSSDDSTSTSDDAAFEESIGPEFDVTKSMLREKYVKQSEQNVKKGNVENNVEIETVANERRKSGIMMKKGAFSGKDIPVVRLGALDRHHGRTVVSEKALDCHLGGMKMVLDDLVTEVLVPLYHPELPRKLGVRPIAGILLHGPPGCGKTTLAHAIANAAHLPFYKISATEVVSGISGASEENIRDLFNKAHRTAPSIIFIDEIDAIASKRENLQREMERRIVTQLMTCMDRSQQILRAIDSDSVPEASDKTSDSSGYVLVIGATNRPDAIDQALRRPGRFDKEIALGVPDENARAEILSVLAHKREIKDKFDPFMIAKCTPGFVGADLEALLDKAGTLAMKRIVDKRRSQLSREQQENIEWLFHPWPLEEIKGLSRTMDDFEEAIKLVQPSTRREGFSPIPDIKWEDVGGLNSLRSVFNLNIIQSIKHPEVDKELGLNPEAGVLLYGPPGCGKTLIAMAVANDASANFIHIRGPEILDKYVGESEKKVREIFSRARTCSPCIIFFDEIDALTVDRRREGESVVGRVLLQLLSELDGGAQRHGVYVIAATNRPEVIDPAFLRTGRLGIHCYVPLPSADERVLILKALTSKMPVSPDLDYNAIAYAEACSNFSGADLAGLVKKAAMFVKEQMLMDQGILYNKSLVIKTSHFEKALEKIVPSVSKERRLHYETLSKNFGAS